MTMTINPDGSATYAITIPAPLTVDRDTITGAYRAAGSVFAYGLDKVDPVSWRQTIAGSIAVHDRMIADAGADAELSAAELARRLYTADVADVPGATPFDNLPDQDRSGYRRRAKRLGDLGVIIEDSARADIAPAAGGAA